MRRFGKKKPLAEQHVSDLNHAYDYAVFLLARRDYTTHELKKKLEDRGYDEPTRDAVVADLESTGKMNNERYSHNFVAFRARRGQGPARIRHQLQKSGIARPDIEQAVKGEDAPDFLALARTTRTRKFGPEVPTDRKERARQARFLQYRGFSNDHIRAALEGDLEDGEPDQP
jgi:regulatory protein